VTMNAGQSQGHKWLLNTMIKQNFHNKLEYE